MATTTKFEEPCRTLFFDCVNRLEMTYAQSASLMNAFDCDVDATLAHMLAWKTPEDVKLATLVTKHKFVRLAQKHASALRRLRLLFSVWSWVTTYNVKESLKNATLLDLKVALRVNPYILLHHEISFDACSDLARQRKLALTDAQSRYGLVLDALLKQRGISSSIPDYAAKAAVTGAGFAWKSDFLVDPYDGATGVHPLYDEQDDFDEPFSLTLSSLRARVAPVKISVFDRFEYLRMHCNIVFDDEKYWLRESYHAERNMVRFVASRCVKSARDAVTREILCVKRSRTAGPLFDL